MAGYRFFFAENSGKTTQESLNIADALLTSVMRGNNIVIESIFSFKNLVKPQIRSETIELMQLCFEQTETAVSTMLKELSKTSEDQPAKLVKLDNQYLRYFCMRNLVDIR